jgi:hypothetical protein
MLADDKHWASEHFQDCFQGWSLQVSPVAIANAKPAPSPVGFWDARLITMKPCCLIDMRRSPEHWGKTKKEKEILNREFLFETSFALKVAKSHSEITSPHFAFDTNLTLQSWISGVVLVGGMRVALLCRAERSTKIPYRADVIAAISGAHLDNCECAVLAYLLESGNLKFFGIRRSKDVFEAVERKCMDLNRQLSLTIEPNCFDWVQNNGEEA